eukprot:765272-Hanusia_phi.AAC.5
MPAVMGGRVSSDECTLALKLFVHGISRCELQVKDLSDSKLPSKVGFVAKKGDASCATIGSQASSWLLAFMGIGELLRKAAASEPLKAYGHICNMVTRYQGIQDPTGDNWETPTKCWEGTGHWKE